MPKQKEPIYIVVFITTADKEEASLISRVLLKHKKAACINILPGVSSLFWWHRKLDSVEESLLVIKTRFILLGEIVQLVKEIHSNDVPEIIALPIIGGNQDYLDWINNETN